MCGIVGALSTRFIDQNVVVRMRDSMVHRGPDHGGMWSSVDGQVCLGHRRLAIVDLSHEANQPFRSSDGRFLITFNGEIYNFKSLRKELRQASVCFRTESDTEVLIESFRYWGEDCLSRLSGMFAFAIWDEVHRRLFCARDRVGEKPFYYAMVDGTFLFASELKALLLWPEFRKKIHYPALVDYFSFGCVAEPKCIWENCWKLPAGHKMWLELSPGGRPVLKQPVAFWDMEFNPDHRVKNWAPVILETLQKGAQEMSFADVPVGVFLSGGVDSSSVTAALAANGCAVKTFTVGFQEEGYDERHWAREVSRLYATQHLEKVIVAGDVSAALQQLLWHYDEPFNDYSYLPTFYLCREARNVITVALSGDGGDELFAGYNKYRRLKMRGQLDRFIPSSLSKVSIWGASAFLPLAAKTRTRLAAYRMDALSMLTDMMTTVFPFSTLYSVARGPLANALRDYRPNDLIRSLLQKVSPEKSGLVNAMRYLDLKLTLTSGILVKVDRASMAVALEVRPLYLHRDMLAVAARIPPALLVDTTESKKLLKSSLKRWLPASVLYRKKMGFALPLPKWINGDLNQLFSCQDSAHALADLFDTDRLQRAIHNHLAAGADLASWAHSLFFLKNWLAKWN